MNKLIQNVLYVFIGASLFFLAKYFYLKPGVKAAQPCPTFEVTMVNGQPLSLSSLKGKYVLIDFWASWCGPCRQEAPALKEFYQEWHKAAFNDATGFELVSIAVEENKESWQSAIEKDGLVWPAHVLELDRFNSALVKKFGVKEIPTKILVGPDGMILGVNQTFNSMSSLLFKRKV